MRIFSKYIKICTLILIHVCVSKGLFATISYGDSTKIQWLSDFGVLRGTSPNISITKLGLHPHPFLIHSNDSFEIPKYCSSLNKSLNLKHKYSYFGMRDIIGVNTDTLYLLDTTYCIQSLLNDSIICPGIIAAYKMALQHKKYLLLIVRDECTNGMDNFNWDLLFDISDRHIVKWIPLNMDNELLKPYYGNFLNTTPTYFGDFNNDGALDLCFYSKNYIIPYAIKNDSAVIIPDHYLKISNSDSEGWCIAIDLSQSKWFSPIISKHISGENCNFQFFGFGKLPNYIRYNKKLPKRFDFRQK